MRVLVALLLLAGATLGQESAASVERELYQALRNHASEASLLALCHRACREYPDRSYPRIVLADTLFRMHRLRRAVNTYDEALARMGERERMGNRGAAVRDNRQKADALLRQILRGRHLESRSSWVGWSALVVLISAVLGLGLRSGGA